jgi:hypothetical protein
VTESLYFLTISFSKWSGYPILNDPETTTYMSKLGIQLETGYPGPSGPGPSGPAGGIPAGVIVGIVGAAIAVTGISVFAIRRRGKATPGP